MLLVSVEMSQGCPFGHRLCSVLLCKDADTYRRAFFWVRVVVQGVVDGSGSFGEGVIEYGVLSVPPFVRICGDVS